MSAVDKQNIGWLASQGIWTTWFNATALEKLATLAGPLFEVPARHTVPDGGLKQPVVLLAEGWAYAYYDFADGRRHVADIHLPGEIVGVPAAYVGSAAPQLGTLTPVTVALIDGAQLRQLADTSHEIAHGMGQLVAANHADTLAQMSSLARHTAYERVAALMLRLYRRLGRGAPSGPTVFSCPVSQQVIGDMLGLSVVHVNRSLRRLAEDGVLHKRASDVEILDARALRKLCES